MATKRPLQQLEEMVTALPPAPTEKKSKKERKLKIKKPPQVDPSSPPPVPSAPTTTTLSLPPVPPPPPPPPLINMDDLFNGDNILNLLNPPAASYQVQLPPMEQACQSVVCPIYQTDLTCFQAQTTGDTSNAKKGNVASFVIKIKSPLISRSLMKNSILIISKEPWCVTVKNP